MIERSKTKAMVAKCQRAKKGIYLPNKKEKNNENYTTDTIDPDLAGNYEYLLQLWEGELEKRSK